MQKKQQPKNRRRTILLLFRGTKVFYLQLSLFVFPSVKTDLTRIDSGVTCHEANCKQASFQCLHKCEKQITKVHKPFYELAS